MGKTLKRELCKLISELSVEFILQQLMSAKALRE
jgi:hypothetical protein